MAELQDLQLLWFCDKPHDAGCLTQIGRIRPEALAAPPGGPEAPSRAPVRQEFSMLQSEIMRESVQSLVEDARAMTEKSLHSFEEVGQICASVTPLPASH